MHQESNMPQIFCDGTEFYGKLIKEYVVHEKGLFIVAPSGVGKTYFVQNQKGKDWIDGDDIWRAAGAYPKKPWFAEGAEKILEVDQKSDIITAECKRLGLWIIGASNSWLVPDAVVIPHWGVHQKWIRFRERTQYNGGAKAEDFPDVLKHRVLLRKQARKNGIKVFPTIEAAVEFLTKN
jgi:hypothetical protein